MDSEELKDRTFRFAIAITRLCRQLRATEDGFLVSRQLFRAGTGISANYRAACRSRSRAEFVARIAVADEEADESVMWLQLLIRGEIRADDKVRDLMEEATQLRAILAKSRQTAHKNLALLNPRPNRKMPPISK